MRLIESFWVALSTYSVIPSPQFEWNQRNMKYAICFFPAVGVICGGLLALWHLLSTVLGIGSVLFAVVAVCLPLLITGGIHMDGFMDTVDALSSHQTRERKLEILKDPHLGAFAVIYCGVYLLASVGLMHELSGAGLIYGLCPVFILSRSLSALCAVTMPNARKAGMLCAFTENAGKTRATVAMIVVLVLSAAAMVVISPIPGAVGVVFGLLTMLYYRRMAMKQFGGVTGDTSGYFLQLCELMVMAGVWIGGLLV